MSAATDSDVLASVRRFFDAGDVATLLTGGYWTTRPPGATEPPYLVLSISEGEHQPYSGFPPGEIIPFTVQATAYSVEGSQDRGAIAQALAALDWYPGLTLPDTTSRVVHVRPVPGKADPDPQQYRGRDVMQTVDAWEVLVDCPSEYDPSESHTETYTTAGTYTFDSAGKVVTLIQVWGAGGGGATAGGETGDAFGGGGGGGFRSGTPTNTPTSLTVVVRAGGAAQTSTSGVYSSVSWDSGSSYLRANTGQCGVPVQSGTGGGGSYAGNVTLVGAYTGGTGGSTTVPAEAGADGGGGAGSAGNGGNGGSGAGAGGTPDGGDGAVSSSGSPGEQPGGGGPGDYASPGAGGAGKVVVTWRWR